jgi:hypothetical protein
MPAVSMRTSFLADSRSSRSSSEARWRGVHRHAEDAAVGAQLFVRGDAVGVQRDQAEVAGAVLGGEGGGDLGGGGGLADAGRADQREHAALVFDGQFMLVGDDVAFQHAGGPGHLVGHVGRQAGDQLADQCGRQAAVQQALRQLRLARVALQLFHEGQHAEALFDQVAHGAQLAQHLVVGALAGAGVDADRLGLGQVHFVAQHRGLAAGGGCGSKRGGGGAAGRGRGFRHRQRRGDAGVDLGLAALEHAFTHVVLEGQRAHAQRFDVLLDAMVRCGLEAGLLTRRALGERGLALRRLFLAQHGNLVLDLARVAVVQRGAGVAADGVRHARCAGFG